MSQRLSEWANIAEIKVAVVLITSFMKEKGSKQ